MTRTYERETLTWDIAELQRLAALEPPQATFFEKADRWVVKVDGKSFAVKPEQIVEQDYDDGSAEAEMAYERFLEDGGHHREAIAVEDAIEREREANDPWLQALRAGREDIDAGSFDGYDDNAAEAELADEDAAYDRDREARAENEAYERAVAPAGTDFDAQVDDLIDFFSQGR